MLKNASLQMLRGTEGEIYQRKDRHVFTTQTDEEEVGRAQLLPFGHDCHVDAKQPSGGLGQARGCSKVPWKVGGESNQRTLLKHRAQSSRRLVREEGRLHPLAAPHAPSTERTPRVNCSTQEPRHTSLGPHSQQASLSRVYNRNDDSVSAVAGRTPQCLTHQSPRSLPRISLPAPAGLASSI